MFGTSLRPRLVVYKSIKHIELQLVDDSNQKTVFGVSTKSLKVKTTQEKIQYLSDKICQYTVKNNIPSIIFDRNGNMFTGSIRELAKSIVDKGIKI